MRHGLNIAPDLIVPCERHSAVTGMTLDHVRFLPNKAPRARRFHAPDARSQWLLSSTPTAAALARDQPKMRHV